MANKLKEEVIIKVYKVRFAGNQEDYENQVNFLFDSLDSLEEHFGK